MKNKPFRLGKPSFRGESFLESHSMSAGWAKWGMVRVVVRVIVVYVQKVVLCKGNDSS